MQWLNNLFRIKSAANRAAGVAKKVKGAHINGSVPDEMQYAKRPEKKSLLDARVVISLLIAFAAGAVLLSFKALTYRKCSFPDFSVKAELFTAGEIIRFSDLTKGGHNWQWKFGDESEMSFEKTPMHVYKFPGEYIVELLVNDRCAVLKKVVIKPFLHPVDSAFFPNIIAPLTAKVGEQVQFTNTTSGARTWNWRFGESSALADDYSASPVYVFRTPGFKVVSLYINGNSEFVTQHKIFVTPEDIKGDIAPPSEFIGRPKPLKPTVVYVKDDTVKLTEIPEAPSLAPVKPKAPSINNTQLKEIFFRISEQKMTIDDLMPYCCSNYGLPVRANNKATTLEIFCNKIKGKKLTLKSIEAVVNENTGCTEQINVSYKIKKGFLDIF